MERTRNLASAKQVVSERVCLFAVNSLLMFYWNVSKTSQQQILRTHSSSTFSNYYNNTTVLWHYGLKCKWFDMLRDKQHQRRKEDLKDWLPHSLTTMKVFVVFINHITSAVEEQYQLPSACTALMSQQHFTACLFLCPICTSSNCMNFTLYNTVAWTACKMTTDGEYSNSNMHLKCAVWEHLPLSVFSLLCETLYYYSITRRSKTSRSHLFVCRMRFIYLSCPINPILKRIFPFSVSVNQIATNHLT